ncbi:hypothetical protein AAMO2058_000345400 [Amorphochlora amoebiformis]
MSKASTKCKDAIKEWLKRERMKAEAKSKAWAEKKAAGAASEDMPKDADGQMRNLDGTVFTNAKDAKKVSLTCMIPPIAKMDAKLNDLPMCEHLALSTNNISSIGNLANLRNLKILSLSRNNIKSLSKLDPLGQTLEQLWLSYNQIEKLDGLSKLRRLRVLYVANNVIKDFNEFAKLKDNTSLEEMVAVGNPCYDQADSNEAARMNVIRMVPTLKKLDGRRVELKEREAAEAKEE